jgi:hypothetical protein
LYALLERLSARTPSVISAAAFAPRLDISRCLIVVRQEQRFCSTIL